MPLNLRQRKHQNLQMLIKNSWSYGAISALEENGVTIGTGDNMYSPKMFVTREAYSQFLYNSINAVEKRNKTRSEARSKA